MYRVYNIYMRGTTLLFSMEGLIYGSNNFILEHEHPKRSITIDGMMLVGAPDFQASFDQYRLAWMTWPQRSYISAMVWEFNALYVSMLYRVTPWDGRSIKKPQLENTLV